MVEIKMMIMIVAVVAAAAAEEEDLGVIQEAEVKVEIEVDKIEKVIGIVTIAVIRTLPGVTSAIDASNQKPAAVVAVAHHPIVEAVIVLVEVSLHRF